MTEPQPMMRYYFDGTVQELFNSAAPIDPARFRPEPQPDSEIRVWLQEERPPRLAPKSLCDRLRDAWNRLISRIRKSDRS